MLNWYNTIFDDGVLSRKLVWQQTIGSVKITLTHVGFATFFKLLPSFLDNKDIRGSLNKYTLYGFSPIIIFKGFHWATLVSLFKTRFINLHGGSITRRHKLSICDYRLSKFLDLMIFLNKEDFYDSYADKYITSPRYDRKNPINMTYQPYVSQYITINKYLNLKIQENEIAGKISNTELKIAEIRSSLISMRNFISINESNIEANKKSISRIKEKFVEGIREKHKASITGRIKNFNTAIKNLRNENSNYSSEILNLESDLSENLNTLNILKALIILLKLNL